MSLSSSFLLLHHSPTFLPTNSRPIPNLNPIPNSSIPTLFTVKFRPLPLHLRRNSSPFPSPSASLSGTPAVEPRIPSPLLTESTRTLATLLSLALAVSRFLEVRLLPQLRGTLSSAAGAAFFAAAKDRPSGYLNTPLTVVAAGLAKWLDIYSGVLMVRVLLSWFPNIPWERQPLSAIRDLCDPYLNLFRNIIPPIFDTLDVSPLLAFAVLGTLGSILNSSRGMY
ncbi:hypothetical protein MLD38_016582 [Melastoma candidum]|uniref:Uncharacterized protein n=1 Tax=Melastoma candidum TaxID=119954 RepID=A0ACB9QPN4_9MYRT|nr:hypothetical protein MLD38_016582 [Melastoma candidum]